MGILSALFENYTLVLSHFSPAFFRKSCRKRSDGTRIGYSGTRSAARWSRPLHLIRKFAAMLLWSWWHGQSGRWAWTVMVRGGSLVSIYPSGCGGHLPRPTCAPPAPRTGFAGAAVCRGGTASYRGPSLRKLPTLTAHRGHGWWARRASCFHREQ